MDNVKEKYFHDLVKDLSSSLIKFSKGNLTIEEVEKIATEGIRIMDLNNSALMHKGMNYYAKELLKKLKKKPS